MKYLQIFLAAVALAFVRPAIAAESVEQSVNFLIDHIAKADATFARNGTTHTPAEAVEHIKAKYEHFKKDIKTPEDFIRLAASKSLLTGKPYTVTPRGGKEETMSEWLTTALKEHRAQAGQ